MLKFYYWPIPARAFFIRALLKYHGIEFEDVIVPFEKRAEWAETKKSLSEDGHLLYPNMPYR